MRRSSCVHCGVLDVALCAAAPAYLRPSAQGIMLEAPADCLDVIEKRVRLKGGADIPGCAGRQECLPHLEGARRRNGDLTDASGLGAIVKSVNWEAETRCSVEGQGSFKEF